MALFYNVCLLHQSLFTTVLLLLAPLATSTLLNPSLVPVLNCFPAELTPNKPTAHNCGAAIARLPSSHVPRDYGLDPGSGRIVLNTALTTVGDPNSDLHLPRSTWLGDCRIHVRMPSGPQVAHLLWDDVREAARDVVNRCVGNMEINPSPQGPGGGGSAQLGPVLIAIMHNPYSTQPGFAGIRPGSSGIRPGFAGSRPGSTAGQGFSIGAYYPPDAQT